MTRCEHSPGIFRKNLTSANRCRKSRRNKSNHSEATVQTFKNLFLSALATTALATPAAAGPDRVWISLGSAHISDRDFEQFNPGVFFTWEGERLGYTVGAFRNSYGEFSTAATVGVPLMRQEDYELGLFAGAAPIQALRIVSAIHPGMSWPSPGPTFAIRTFMYRPSPAMEKASS